MSMINESYQAALLELEGLEAESITLLEQLDKGIELGAAYAVIDRYWDGMDAAKLKTQLSGTFPKENGEIIRSAPFNEKLGVGISLIQTKDYFARVFPAIIAEVQRVYDIINSHDINDTEALLKLNDFRKEPVRFIELVKGGWFEGKDDVIDGKTLTWETLRKDCSSIENGDYLFLTDYNHEIRQAQKALEENLLGFDNPKYNRLYDVSYTIRRIRAMVKVTSLFLDFLKFHTDEETA